MKILLAALILIAPLAQQKVPTAAKAWIKAPAAGEKTAMAFVVVDNPTMYDVYLTQASTDVADRVQFQKVVKDKTEVTEFVIAPAYGSVELTPEGVRMVLMDLKRPLKPGDKVWLALTTDGGLQIDVEAEVKQD
jgi:periplasmic copper chaperone A